MSSGRPMGSTRLPVATGAPSGAGPPSSSVGGTGGCSVTRVLHTSAAGPAASRGCDAETGGSDVEEADVLGVALDERAAALDVLTHENGEHLVGGRRVLEGDLQQQALGGVHRRLGQL